MVGTRIADDYEYIKARMEEIAKERSEPKAEHEVPEPVEAVTHLTLDWAIYAPVNVC